jgi:iron complex outermembrane receptor protein
MIKSSSISLVALATMLVAARPAFAQGANPTAAAAPTEAAPGSEIIVTGTRATGITAAESAAPIKLVGSEAIGHVGQPNLNQVLTQLVPSFTAQSFGGDAANLTLTASLRGLNPNETLVLVNGKRRHGTANLHVLASPTQGGAAPDLDFITPASIDHIEVLEDGASAQYGSDAIAGVINIILKKKEGGSISVTGGKYYAGDGATYSGSANYGWVTDRGYLNFTGFWRFHDFSQRGKQDIRVLDPTTGALPASVAQYPTLASDYQALPGYPDVNHIRGDARSRLGVFSYNTGYDITDAVSFYSFGSIGYRRAESYENVRLPDRVLASGTPGVAGSAADYDDDVANHPDYIFSRTGFNPQEAIREVDGSATGGLKGDIGGLHWDLSTTYGEDRDDIYTLHSVNRDLFIDTYASPTRFYDGAFHASEWTSDLDLTYAFGTFATVAGGAEYRRNTYDISAGDPASYYKTGAQSFPGYSPSSAGDHERHNYALYGDVALNPIEGLKLDGAVRYEHYSDFGGKVTWKATGRYDFTSAIAIRGTASTGFRAPTLAEEYYTQVNVSPTSAFVQLAANSPAAKVLGIPNLKPEKATNYSIGTVLRPVSRLTITVDAYQIRIRDRIVGSAEVDTRSTAFDLNDPVWRAIDLSGYAVETLNSIGIESFVNGPTTRTRGVDFVASYDANLDRYGKATFTLSGAYNKTKITKQGANPTIISAPVAEGGVGQTLYDAQLTSFLTTATPRFKIIGGVNWSLGDFAVIARETFYSKTRAILNDGGGTYTPTHISPAGITDLELDYHITPRITLAAGANNLFDKRPNVDPYIGGETASGGVIYRQPLDYSPYGINGGYWYGRVDVKL